MGDGEVGIQEYLLQSADFIIDIILMGSHAGMLLEQLCEMGFAEARGLCRFAQVKSFLPVVFYVLSAPSNFLSPPVYFLKGEFCILINPEKPGFSKNKKGLHPRFCRIF